MGRREPHPCPRGVTREGPRVTVTLQVAGTPMTVIGSASSAPRAIPTSARPQTTGTLSPDVVRQSIEIESGWTGLRRRRISDRPYLSASLTVANLFSSPSVMCVTTKMGLPSTDRSYPWASKARSQRGGLHSTGFPSTARSNPSIRRPAIQPRSGGEPSGIGAPVKPRGSWRTEAASWAVTRPVSVFVGISFALRGAPCGDHAHCTPSNRPRHDQHPRSIREADRSPALLVARVLDIFDGHLAPVVENAGGFLEPDVALAKIGERLRRIPVEHAPETTDRPSSASYHDHRCSIDVPPLIAALSSDTWPSA